MLKNPGLIFFLTIVGVKWVGSIYGKASFARLSDTQLLLGESEDFVPVYWVDFEHSFAKCVRVLF